jgi:hypothetical protein
MQHSVEQMYMKVQAMVLLAEEAKKAKYDNADAEGNYDVKKVTHLVEHVQALAGDLYNDKTIHPKLKEKQLNAMWKELHQDA